MLKIAEVICVWLEMGAASVPEAHESYNPYFSEWI